MKHKKLKKIKGQRGQVLIIFGFMIFGLLTLIALTVDLGHIYLVRNELQNAADAAALEGASYLYPSASGGLPNFTLAQTKATAAIPRNKVDNVTLSNGNVSVGYWDLTGTLSALLGTTIVPVVGQVPAVMVTISKSTGNNGGPISLFFGSLLGVSTVNLSATAVAVMGSPSTAQANSLFPIAMAQNLYDNYWDKANNQPMIDPQTGQPYVFKISEGAQGGWTTFNSQNTDTNSIINLITNGNPTPLKIGDPVWLASGVKTAIYGSVPANKDTLVAITATTAPGTQQTITAFGAIHIDFAVGGSGKYIQVHFIKDFEFLQGEPGGPSYGAYTPPRLAK